ncbi:UDP-N-acetylmuramate dehydrogenase [Chlamydiifrater phoenicopteri]|uniref:UDP-N-acetylmuramate dehydrogenase n=1 Tax=Chlamydiifrater phoenicopteri TaxID=2681469 RepID=UPI001BCB134C|nr:UDP-N-acetylmuramate dehydrogenase [Chlamydiifrater phoenicopteri]
MQKSEITFPFPVKEGVPLSKYSTFRIGGPAKFFKSISSVEEAVEVFRFLHKHPLPHFILGKGSNCLFDDLGFHGLVLLNNLNKKNFLTPHLLKVYSGHSFAALGRYTTKKNLGGLEFASGIPGSVGGAIFMNAGAQGQSTSDSVLRVEAITPEGKIVSYSKSELKFEYRSSRFQSVSEFILSAEFQLYNNPASIKLEASYKEKRVASQPYNQFSAGCIFRNPSKDMPAGKLIEECGLKGLSVGDAIISPLHANFIVNRGAAKAKDVLKLINIIKEAAQKRGFSLEEEVLFIPHNRS